MDRYIQDAIAEWHFCINVDSHPGPMTGRPFVSTQIDVDYLAQTFEDTLYTTGIRCEVEIVLNDKMESGTFAVGGYFTPDDYTKEFDLIWYFPSQTICYTTTFMTQFAQELITVCLHEYRHWQQNEARGDVLADTEYKGAENKRQRQLGNQDELDAYAIGIAFMMTEYEFGLDRIKYSGAAQIAHFQTIHDLKKYNEAFGYSPDHPIIKKLYKKIAGHLL